MQILGAFCAYNVTALTVGIRNKRWLRERKFDGSHGGVRRVCVCEGGWVCGSMHMEYETEYVMNRFCLCRHTSAVSVGTNVFTQVLLFWNKKVIHNHYCNEIWLKISIKVSMLQREYFGLNKQVRCWVHWLCIMIGLSILLVLYY